MRVPTTQRRCFISAVSKNATTVFFSKNSSNTTTIFGITQQRALVSSTKSSGDIGMVTGPSEKLKSWQSGARLVKNTTVENQYLEHIREVHDPSQHLKTIEDELKGTIGKALGKQGQKVLAQLRLMDQERRNYEELLLLLEENENENDDGPTTTTLRKKVLESAKKYNSHRKECMHARWELIVHRQAVGFIVGNHKYVMEKFPIPEALPEEKDIDNDDDDEGAAEEAKKKEEAAKKFGTQLDWWQTIGRWR